MVCEICEGMSLVKQDGVFVCADCGTQYSVAEAKNLLKEVGDAAPVVVASTQTAAPAEDNVKKQEIANKLEVIKNESDLANNEMVKKLCLEVLSVEPDNYVAIMYNGLAEGWQSSVANDRTGIALKELQRAVAVMAKKLNNDFEFSKEWLNIGLMEQVKRLSSALATTYSNYAGTKRNEAQRWQNEYSKGQSDLWNYVGSSVYYTASERVNGYKTKADKLNLEAIAIENQGEYKACSMYFNVLISILDNVKDPLQVCDEFYGRVRYYSSSYSKLGQSSTAKSLQESVNNKLSKREAAVQRQKLEQENRKREEYWAEHAEERAQIDAELAKIDEELISLNQQKNELMNKSNVIRREAEATLPLEEEKDKCKDVISSIQQEMRRLGFLQGKKKKELQEQLDSENSRLGELSQRIEAEKQERNNKMNERLLEISKLMNPITVKIGELDARKIKLQAELNKNR